MNPRRLTIALAMVIVLIVPTVAIASHQFTDVPTSHVFHSSISWLADEGITLGCNPPSNTRFCPDDPVTRGQMAGFLKRFYDRFIGNGGIPVGLGVGARDVNAAPFSGNGAVTGLSLNLHVPVPGVLFINATAEVGASGIDAFYCGINAGGSVASGIGEAWRAIDLTVSSLDTCATQAAFAVQAGTRVVRLVIFDALSTTQVRAGSISAQLYADGDWYGLLGSDEPVTPPPLADELPTKITDLMED